MEGKLERRELTFGEKAVGLELHHEDGIIFKNIELAKSHCAKPIDQMNDLRSKSESGEYKALCTIAIRKLQDAQMAMAKAITWQD
jgi:hypothetical protein